MSGGHTPGPWWVDEPYKNDVVCAEGGITVTQPKCIEGRQIVVGGPLAANDVQSYANARLIAAAPEMLAALTAAEALFHHTFAMNGTVHKQVRAAIAKARGEA